MGKIAIDIGQSFLPSGHFLRELTGVGKLVSIIVSNAIVIAGIIMLFLIVLAGISMIGCSQSGNPQKVAQGKQTATIAIIGFIIIFISYLIIRVVEVITSLRILS